jgi:hypothetical protein
MSLFLQLRRNNNPRLDGNEFVFGIDEQHVDNSELAVGATNHHLSLFCVCVCVCVHNWVRYICSCIQRPVMIVCAMHMFSSHLLLDYHSVHTCVHRNVCLHSFTLARASSCYARSCTRLSAYCGDDPLLRTLRQNHLIALAWAGFHHELERWQGAPHWQSQRIEGSLQVLRDPGRIFGHLMQT